ncbi:MULTISPECIES: beta-glucosidase [Derxia]|uniref:Beta-glucosidase n=1 Tax=Derxia gummosa DSM 723 TaxID=1121388 RepID=A0A8B6X0U3_9BURK|nr:MULTISPECIES: beta-glucosidase [Derxia]
MTPLFDSFFMAGFECSTHRRHDGRRLDLIAATGHDRLAAADYALVAAHGMRAARDGLRWHLIETSPGRYDWSSFLPMLDAACEAGVPVVWDLCHYGWPDDIDIWRPAFVERFAAFARAAAEVVRDQSDEVPWWCPVNEISYWAWAGGDAGLFNPLAQARGFELKHQLVRAAIAGIDAVRSVDPRARILNVDPLIRVASPPGATPEQALAAAGHHEAQYQGWDMLAGNLWPGLGGSPDYLDVIGINYYPDNQWYFGAETLPPSHPEHRPLRHLLAEVHRRYGRPLLLAETGAEGPMRAPWLDLVCAEVMAAIDAGTPVGGICLYPVFDYPGWVDERHCATGCWSHADADGRRPPHEPMLFALARQVDAFAARSPSRARLPA